MWGLRNQLLASVAPQVLVLLYLLYRAVDLRGTVGLTALAVGVLALVGVTATAWSLTARCRLLQDDALLDRIRRDLLAHEMFHNVVGLVDPVVTQHGAPRPRRHRNN